MTDHKSDCAVHNEPAMPAGPCDCGEGIVEATHPIIESMGDEIIAELTNRRALRHVIDNIDGEELAEIKEVVARAALTAALDHMREPSDSMIEAAVWRPRDDYGIGLMDDDAKLDWQAMLSQLRKEALP